MEREPLPQMDMRATSCRNSKPEEIAGVSAKLGDIAVAEHSFAGGGKSRQPHICNDVMPAVKRLTGRTVPRNQRL